MRRRRHTTTSSLASAAAASSKRLPARYCGVLGPDGCVYGIPRDAAQVLRFDPQTREATLVGADLRAGGDKWYGGVLGPAIAKR